MEAAILQFFSSIRNPFLDAFFGVFSLLGEAMLVGGVAILIFWLAPRRAGEQIIMTALTSFPLNSLVKFLVARPRPFVAGVVEYRQPFFGDELDPYASFPSGHTQSSSSLLLASALSVPKRREKIASVAAACVAVLLVMLARMYFGAHYPTDVLAGLALGVAVEAGWAAIFAHAHSYRHFVLLGLAVLSLIPCLFPNAAHDYIQATGLLTGAAVALAAGHFVLTGETAPFPRRLWRIPVGGALVAAVFAFTLLFPAGEGFSLLKWFLLAFTAGLPAPFAFECLKI